MNCLFCSGVIGSCGCGWIREGAGWALPGDSRRLLHRLAGGERGQPAALAGPAPPCADEGGADGPVTDEVLLTAREVAALFGVGCHAAARWADRGYLTDVRTPGGQRRFLKKEVLGFLHGGALSRRAYDDSQRTVSPGPPQEGVAGGSVTDGELLTARQVLAMFGVTQDAVARWTARGYLTEVRTADGMRRYREDEIRALLHGGPRPGPRMTTTKGDENG